MGGNLNLIVNGTGTVLLQVFDSTASTNQCH